ncbi:alanine:cation symporter family protein, partial [Bacillus inaquosorum]|uniref:alanine:cation symporter family protein n=1 Tax=Bacillus inaquosorum TaxID=483913 RepID=UPI0022828857
TSTDFIILFSDAYHTPGLSGIALTQASLSAHVGSWASGFLAILILLFGFCALIGNYYYGETNIGFLNKSKKLIFIYRIGVLAMIVFGCVAKVQLVWDLADLFMGLMVVVNLIAIFLLSKVVFTALKDYTRQKKAGKDPVFYKDVLKNHNGIECWPLSDTKADTNNKQIS